MNPAKSSIYKNGCLAEAKTWMNRNLVPIAGVVIAIALLQVSASSLLMPCKSH